MYVISVLLLTLVLPMGSAAAERLFWHSDEPIFILIGFWMVFWAGGVRLVIAGLRQVFQPRFTAEEIFNLKDAAAFPIVRELGFANLAMGSLALLILPVPSLLLAGAFVTALYYGLAGVAHVLHRGERNAKRIVAMLSDLWVFVVEAAFAAMVAAFQLPS
jgi:hypothetical protein